MCRLLLVVIACLGTVGCDAERFGYVKKAKYDLLQKQVQAKSWPNVSSPSLSPSEILAEIAENMQ